MKESESYEFKESTVDEAVAAGLKSLGLTIDEVSVEVKSYGGLFSKACVVITPNPVEEETEEPVEEAAGPEEPEVDQEEVSEAERVTVKFVSDLLLKMGIKSAITSKVKGNEINIAINGDDAGMIIGYRGEVLDAIQYYALVIANKGEKNFIRVQIDAGNYRTKRQETLSNLAARLARKASKTGRRVELEPMNPYERRIIHTTLANDKYVSTESEGEGKYRHVVIIPKSREVSAYRNGGDYKSRNNYGYNDYRDRRDAKPVETEKEAPTKSSYSSSDFKKKGPAKTRSFGYNNKKF